MQAAGELNPPETPRLRLRPLTEDDLPQLCRTLQDPVAMTAYEHAFSDAEAREWLARQLARYRRYGYGLWAVCAKETNVFVGQCGVTWQEAEEGRQVLEVGYLFERAHWHKGYAAEAARACRDWAFRQLEAPEVYSIIRDTNLPSQRVAVRNGMQPAGQIVKHYYGVEMPHVLYRITRAQWLRLQSEAPELLDVYDAQHRPTGKTVVRGAQLAPGGRFLGVSVTVMDREGRVLLTRRAPEKQPFPNTWETTGGAALAGETSAGAVSRELCEETGLAAFPREFVLLDVETRPQSFMDHYLLRRQVDVRALTFQPGETCAARMVPLEQALALAQGELLDGFPMAAPVARRLQAMAPRLRALAREKETAVHQSVPLTRL